MIFMDKILKKITKYYKIMLCSFFVILIITFLMGKMLKASAAVDNLDIDGEAIVYLKDVGDVINSGQASAVTPTGKTIFVLLQQPETPSGIIGSHLSTLVILKKNSSGEYVEKARINDLDCGHANGATYFKENNKHYLLVATSADPSENPATIIKYELNLSDSSGYSVVSQKSISLNRRVNGIAWDNDQNRIIVSHSEEHHRSLVAYDTTFTTSNLIREIVENEDGSFKSGFGAPRLYGRKGDYYNNQDIAYYNNKIYVITAGSTKSNNPCKKFAVANGFVTEPGVPDSSFCANQDELLDNYLTVIDANTGDFSKLFFINGQNIGDKLRVHGYYSSNVMRELEDILFIDEKMYLGIQKGGNYVINEVTNSAEELFSYNKLYVNYKMNGGKLSSSHGSNVSSSGDDILIGGNKKVLNGYTGEYLIPGGLYDYNDPSAINIEKTGYHLTWEAEWKTADGTVYSQSERYSVYALADTSISDKTITLYANWIANNYSFSYDPNGGSGADMPFRKCVYDKSYTLDKNTYTRQGYKFVGWTLNRDGTGTVYSDRATVSNLTSRNEGTVMLYAKWEPISYKIYMKDNTSVGSTYTKTVSYNESFNLGTFRPIRTGYDLIGWSKSSTATTPTYAVSENVTNLSTVQGETVTLYAVWRGKQFTINFSSTGGSPVSSIVRNMNDTIGELPVPTRTGYTFAGWFTSTTGGSQVTSSTRVTSNMNLYARWNPIKFSIAFNSNGGTGTMANQTVTYGVSQNFTNNKFTKPNYEFVGWNTKSDSSGSSFSDGQVIPMLSSTNGATIELFAIWSAKQTYSITYNLDGGSLTTNNPTGYDITTETFMLNNPSKEGYTFKGWTGSNGNTPALNVYVNKGTTGNLNYKANYEANKYKIEFNIGDETKELEVEYGSTITDIPNPKKTGYSFLGWLDEDGYVLGATVGIGDKVYNPEFRPNKYKIYYDSNGGSGEMSTQEFIYDQKDRLIQNKFTRESGTFKNWSTKNDGKGETYSNEEEIFNLTAVDDDGIVLYAIWELASGDTKTDSGSNPKTGAFLSIGLILSIFVVGFITYLISSKNKKFKKI